MASQKHIVARICVPSVHSCVPLVLQRGTTIQTIGSVWSQWIIERTRDEEIPCTVTCFHLSPWAVRDFFLPEPIPACDCTKRYLKGLAPYAHSNIEPESHYNFPFTDVASVWCTETIVHMANRDGHKFAVLVASWDIYSGDELLLRFQRGIHDNYQVNRSDQGISCETKQKCYKVQHLWTQNRDKANPYGPVRNGMHVGQKYD